MEDVERGRFQLPRDPRPQSGYLENTFGVIILYCVSNNNPTVGQFVEALNTSIINGLAFRDLRNTNCEDKTKLLDNLHEFLEETGASLQHPSTNHGNGADGAVPIHVAVQVQLEMLNCDMKLVSSICQWFHCQTCATWHQLC